VSILDPPNEPLEPLVKDLPTDVLEQMREDIRDNIEALLLAFNVVSKELATRVTIVEEVL